MANLFKILLVSGLFYVQWNVYRPMDNAFSAKLPGEYTVANDTLETDLGKIPIASVLHHCGKDNICGHDDPHSIYALIHMDYPLGTFPADSTELINTFLDETIESRRIELGEGTVLDYQADLEMDDYSGRIVRYTNADRKVLCKGKFIIYDDRLIALQVVSDKKQIQRKEVTQFLNSFDANED